MSGTATSFVSNTILTASNLNAAFALTVPVTAGGQPGGWAILDAGGKVPAGMIPASAGVLAVSSAYVNNTGHLILTYSDGSTADLGLVQGPAGLNGTPGLTVTAATINGAGHLILTRSDASTIDAGVVVGVAGVPGLGVASAAIDGTGHLILTMSNSSTINAGIVTGPAGVPGNSPTVATMSLLTPAGALSNTDMLPMAQPSHTTGPDQIVTTSLASLVNFVASALGLTPPTPTPTPTPAGPTAPLLPAFNAITLLARFCAKQPGSISGTWKDLGPNGWDLTARTSLPTATSDPGTAAPAFLFNGTTDVFKMPAGLYTALAGPANQISDHPITVLIVTHPLDNTNRSLVFAGDSAGVNFWSVALVATNGLTVSAGSTQFSTTGIDAVKVGIPMTAAVHTMTASKTIVTNSGFADVAGLLWQDGVAITGVGTASHTGICEMPAFTQGFVGANFAAGAVGQFFNGYIVEVLFCAGTPTTSDIAAWRSYATSNWGAA